MQLRTQRSRIAAVARSVLSVTIIGTALASPALAREFPAGVAEKLDVGGQWVGSIFTDPKWKGLNARRARLAVPWDIALLPPGAAERREFADWVTKAKAQKARVEPFVSFWHSKARHCRRGKFGKHTRHKVLLCRTPTVAAFQRAFRAFRANPAWAHIRLFSGWNEPNFLKTVHKLPDTGFLTPDGKHWFHTSNCARRETPGSCGPMAAARYYLAILRACPACKPIAGEFTSSIGKRTSAYWKAYRRYLGAHVPKTWAIHPYQDVRDFQQEQRTKRERTAAPVTKTFARWVLAGPRKAYNGDRVQIWLTAVGARVRDERGRPVGRDPERLQCSATAFINWLPTVREGENAITRFYVYNYRNLGTAKQDFGLVAPDGRARRAYRRFRDRSGAPC